jgi:pre-rRNA-processing protein IPI3
MQVTGLSVSMDGSTLLSGSKDCTARVWDVSSRQCLKVLEHKGGVIVCCHLLETVSSVRSALKSEAACLQSRHFSPK